MVTILTDKDASDVLIAKHKLKSAHHNGVVDCAIAINRLIEDQVRGLMRVFLERLVAKPQVILSIYFRVLSFSARVFLYL